MRNARLEFVDDLAPPLSLAEEEAYLRREGRSIMALVGIALNRAISHPPDERAVALLREAMEKDPGNPLPYQALFTRGLDFRLDEKLVDRCLQFHPDDGDALLMKAEIARNAGKADEAARWAAKAANSPLIWRTRPQAHRSGDRSLRRRGTGSRRCAASRFLSHE